MKINYFSCRFTLQEIFFLIIFQKSQTSIWEKKRAKTRKTEILKNILKFTQKMIDNAKAVGYYNQADFERKALKIMRFQIFGG